MSVRVLVAVTVALLAAVYALRCRADASTATARAARLDAVVRALELERDRAVRATVLRPHQRYDKEQADTLLPPLLVREAVRNALRDIAGEVPASEAASAARPTPSSMEADYAELVRAELANGVALDGIAGWCRCPPLPDFRKLCRALGSPAEPGQADAEAEAEQLRRRLAEQTLAASLSREDAMRALLREQQGTYRAAPLAEQCAQLVEAARQQLAGAVLQEVVTLRREAALNATAARKEGAAQCTRAAQEPPS